MTGKDQPVDVPRPPDAPQLVVGIGASAGGIAALREFFANVTPDSGHAYVVILHLSPDHESRLAEVLQPVSAIPVAQVTESVRMRPNHVYVVSPNHSLSVSDGMLVASDVTRTDQRRASVDLFFRALAEADATRAVSVILSGTGSDGSSGFKRVKQSGGLAIAQDPATAEFPDMPAAAIATGLMDLVLRPADMPSYIRDYGQRLTSMAPLPRPDAESELMTSWWANNTTSRSSRRMRPRLLRDPRILAGDRLMPADLHLRLLEQYAPPSILVTEEHTVVHITEGATRYLSVPAGEPSRDVTRLARLELRHDLRAALQQAARDNTNVDVRGVRVAIDGADVFIRLQVRPALQPGDPARGFFLVLFEEQGEHPRTESAVELNVPAGMVAARLNEELTTVNEELKIKIEELAHTNNDVINFINSSDIASIFLDRDLRVKLSTPRAANIFNLLPADRGRPLTDITSRLVYDRLQEDLRQVMDEPQVIEREVATDDHRAYLMRVLPYRTTDGRVDGTVITFLDITTRLDAEDRVRLGEERLRLVIESTVDYAIFTMTPEGLVDSWNPGAQRMFGYERDEIVGQRADILFTPEDRAAGVPAAELARAAAEGRADAERWHLRKNGLRLYCSGVTTRLGDGQPFGFAKIARDLTEQRQMDIELRNARVELEERVRLRTTDLQMRVAEHAAAEEHVTALLRKVVTAQEDERARIARDLHDQLGQQVIALRLALERHRDRCRMPERSDEDLQRGLALTSQIDREVDFLAWELRPAMLDDLGLSAALPRFVAEWSKHYGTAAECHTVAFSQGHLTPDDEVTFYRVAQEALNNVFKHAHATRVDVLIETRDGIVTLVVEDDGIGFDTTDRYISEVGIGLTGMRERAALSGATLDIESSPGQGTSVFLRRKVAS